MYEGNLPAWPGAASVYSRLEYLATRIQQAEYTRQRARNRTRGFKFIPNEEGLRISAAMGRGDENECKTVLYILT